MKKSLLMKMAGAFLVLSTTAVTTATSFAAPPKGTNGVDRTFIRTAAMGGTAEIALSKVALMRSKNPRVIAFARQMVHDHTMAGKQLMGVAMKVEAPAPMVLDAKHQAIKARLMHLSGRAFDKAYLTAMVVDHTKTVDLFQNEIAHGRAMPPTEFAKKNVGTIQAHLAMVRDLAGQKNMPSKIMNPPTS